MESGNQDKGNRDSALYYIWRKEKGRFSASNKPPERITFVEEPKKGDSMVISKPKSRRCCQLL